VEHDRDGPVVLRARHAAAVVLARHEAALAVARIAVGEVRRLAEYADRARLLVPSHDPVVRDVAPQETARIAEPHGPLRPPEPGGEALDGAIEDAVLGEAVIEHLDGRIGVTHEVHERSYRVSSVTASITAGPNHAAL